MVKTCDRTGLPMHDDGHQWRVLGALAPVKAFALPNFGASFDVIPERDWIETSVDDWAQKIPVWNQGQHGACVGHGSATAFTFAWLISGQAYHEFSPTSIYARINGGRDQGAQVGDGLLCLKKYGAALMSQFGEDKIWEQQLTADVRKTATRFRVVEAYKINDWTEMGTALMKGFMVVSGLAVGDNFSNLDRNGVAPLPDRVTGGHCLAHYGLRQVGGTFVAKTRNSWGMSWGVGGDCYLQKDAWNPRYGFPFDAFAIGGVMDDPEETDTDSPVLV
jgi:hypothetical protein